MWTFTLIIVILLGIKILCRVIGGLGLLCALITDNADDIEGSTGVMVIWGVVKLIVTIPLFVWGLVLLF